MLNKVVPALTAMLALAAWPAHAADVGVSVQISQPGVYGRIDIGRYPQPQVVVQQPVIVAQPRVVVAQPQPVYMWVPPGHQKNWRKHCGRYNACGVPVYFVAQATLLRSRARILPSLVGCAVVLMAGLAVRADIAKPYRTAPLMSQGTSTSVPELRGLLLTKGDAAWIGWVDAAGDSLGARDVPATAIDAPGALFAFNHSGYANPWLGHQAPVTLSSLRLACTSNPPADLFVLQPGTQPGRSLSTTGLTRSLAACGLRFPGDFRVVDQRASARPRLAMTIWRLEGGWRPAQGAAR